MAERLEYRCDPDTVLLLGTKYALLRDEFLAQEGKRHEAPGIARKILVTLGGADPHNVMLKVVQALKRVDVRGLEAKIVVGTSNLNCKTLEKEIQRDRSAEGTFQIIRNGDMPKLMAWADTAVSAGGSTCWELAFMGVPFLVLILAENQEGIARGLGETETAMNCGWFHKLSVKYLAECLDKMIADDNRRAEYSKRGRRLVDGLGTDRIIDHMAAL
jgi:spore coat polysaccharide biosynthesis predicted glycosyltransferase SpsG